MNPGISFLRVFFFFSSRRRHTRCYRDWSSDVCSSDLAGKPVSTASLDTIADGIAVRIPVPEALELMASVVDEVMLVTDDEMIESMRWLRSEERRVGKERGGGWERAR